VAFIKEVCNGEPDPWQKEYLEALATRKKLALKACKGPGKSRAIAWSIWWWLFTRKHSNVVCMSITGDNLRDNLWAELARVQNEAPLLKQFFEHKGERIEAKESPKTWWCSARSFPQNADKSQQANTIAGMHGKYPMIACDEVGDYPDGVIVAAEAIFANDVDARLVIAGNPTQTEGPLYRVCTRDRYDWWVKEITGDPDDPARASRISLEWARKMINDWGRDNDWVKVNVFGQFPSAQSNKLLGPDEVHRAMQNKLPESHYGQDPIIMGLDVARFGDNASVLFRRQGKMAFKPMEWREMDLMSLADQVMRVYLEYRPAAFFIDQVGVGGGVVDRLRQLGAQVIPVDSGGKPIEERFYDRRAEMWWTMAEWIKQGACLPFDSQMVSELLAPNFDFTKTGRATKFKLESKKDLVKRGQPSPDHADALALTFAAPVFSPLTQMQVLDDTFPTHRPINGGTEVEWDPFSDDGGRAN
jgi:hypothetical protein